jgi:MtN3 and saliva related transmembrane protein
MEQIILLNIATTIAGVCTTLSYLPQVIKSYKSKQEKDISFLMLILFFTGIFFWFVAGILLPNIPMIIFNFLTLVLVGVEIFFKIKFDYFNK